MKQVFLIALLFASQANAQQYPVPVPKDVVNEPIYGGLGAPRVFEPTVTATAYGADYITVPTTGADFGRQFRSFYVYNPSATRTIYACFGPDTGCSSDDAKIRPQMGIVYDGILAGYYNRVTRIYFKLDSAGSVQIDAGLW